MSQYYYYLSIYVVSLSVVGLAGFTLGVVLSHRLHRQDEAYNPKFRPDNPPVKL